LDYEELRRIQRMERNSPGLAQIPNTFYSQLAEYINALIAEYKKSSSADDIRKMENSIRAAKDVFQRRTQKIILSALRNDEKARTKLVEIEQEYYKRIQESISQMNDEFENVLVGERPFTGSTAAQEAAKAIGTISALEDEEQSLNTVLVRILKEVPKFVSSEMQEYGPYEAREIVKIPQKEADLLLGNGFAEKV